jgi:hypothetical protein
MVLVGHFNKYVTELTRQSAVQQEATLFAELSRTPWAGQAIAKPFQEYIENQLFALRRFLSQITKGGIEFIT